MPKVTIAIPTYNRQEYLKQAIFSILAQTFQDFEILVFDNHSDYDIVQALAEFKDSRLSLLINPVNKGGFANFQRIFAYKFNTPYLVIFHDDDAMHPRMLEREIGILERNPNVVWAGAGLKFVPDGKDMFDFAELKELADFQIFAKEDLTKIILKNFHLAFDSVMYRAVFLEDPSPYKNSFDKWWDRPILINMAAKGKAAVLKEPLVNYRTHAGQDSKVEASDKLECQFNLLNFYEQNLPQPLSAADSGLFKTSVSNSAILSALSFSKTFADYRRILKTYKQRGFFNWTSLNLRGLWYLLKVLKKFALASWFV